MNPEQYFLSLPGGTVKFYKNEAHRPFDKATKSSTLLNTVHFHVFKQ